MLYLQKAVINIKRHKMKSLLTILVCAFLVMFLFLYIGGLQANTRQFVALPDAVPVYARVSSLNGTLYDGITISDMRISGLEASSHVTELSYTVKIWAASKRIAEEEVPNLKSGELNLPFALGINSLSTFADLSENDITFIEDAGPEAFEGDEAVCIVRDSEVAEYNLRPGETVWFTPFYLTYPNDSASFNCNWLGEYQVEVIGSFSEPYNAGSGEQIQAVFPAKWLRKLHNENDIMFNASSARFRVANPLALNDFKAEMKELMFMSVISQAEYSQRGVALTVMDETFVKAATRLMDNISLMRAFTPFVCVTVGLVGFVVSYLLLHGRKPEIALMRSLGMSGNACFGLLMLENAALNLIGGIAGLFIAMSFVEMNAVLAATVIALFFACYMAGTAAALKIIGRFSVMAALTALE